MPNISQHEVYGVWIGMKARCGHTKSPANHNYGGRGIKVCDRWLGSKRGEGFRNFIADMGDRPLGTSIERINNDGNYEPGNCCWATAKQQGENKRCNRFVTIQGKTVTQAEASRMLFGNNNTLCVRLSSGFTLDEALSFPVVRGGDPRGLKKGHRNSAILTIADVRRIRMAAALGMARSELAAMFNTVKSNIYLVVANTTWKDVPLECR